MKMVKTSPKKFADYFQFIDEEVKDEIYSLVDNLSEKKIAMVNATSFGGGVAEKLHSMVPLLQDAGLYLDWWVMEGNLEFFNVTKDMHNGLQGKEDELTKEAREIFFKYNQQNAEKMKDWDYDFVVVHDPQPAALKYYYQGITKPHWIWRCHIDTSTPNTDYWDFMYHHVKDYQAVIFTMEQYVKKDAEFNCVYFISPSIDPLSTKNLPMELEEAQSIIGNFGMDTERPIISQVSRFDPWKDPLGVIEVYKLVKKEFPSTQLALVGSMASDDPEGWDCLYHCLRRAGEDYDIKIITNFNGITNVEVNAFQTASDVVLQKSLREGFGLTVAEAIWKGTPVIGGDTGGIRLQIEDGVTGYLVRTVEECARRVLNLLRNPQMAQQMAEKAQEKVRREFLVTKNALDYLRLFNHLASGD